MDQDFNTMQLLNINIMAKSKEKIEEFLEVPIKTVILFILYNYNFIFFY